MRSGPARSPLATAGLSAAPSTSSHLPRPGERTAADGPRPCVGRPQSPRRGGHLGRVAPLVSRSWCSG